MGYAVVIFESTLSSVAFRRPREGKMLAALGKVVVPFLWAWAGIRLVDVVLRGKLAFFAKPDGYVLLFLVEMALIVVPAVLLASPERRADAGALFRAALLMILAGTLYRIDTFIVAFRPGAAVRVLPEPRGDPRDRRHRRDRDPRVRLLRQAISHSDGSGPGPRGRRVPGEVTP